MSKLELQTERLVLTPLGTRFLETVNEYAMDPENTTYMIHLPNRSSEETLEFLKAVDAEWAKTPPGFYEVALLYQDRHIGAASIYPENGTAELGWIVNRRYWGNGFAFEAASAIVAYFSSHFGITKFVAHCDAENVASYKTMEKLGMQRMGVFPGRKNRSAVTESLEYQYELFL